MEPLRIEGGREVTTPELLLLIQEAKELEYDQLFPPGVAVRLDPDGIHLIFARPLDLEDAVVKSWLDDGVTPNVTGVNVTMDGPMPCEVLTKLKGVKASPTNIPKFLLDVKVERFLKLRVVDTSEFRMKRSLKTKDGQHRRNF